MDTLPVVKLDTTLADLYRQCSPHHANKRYGHVYCGANSCISISKYCPRTLKYLYQESTFQNRPTHELREDNEELRCQFATKHVVLVTQRDAMIAGDATVIFFDSIPGDAEQLAHDRRFAAETISILDPSQRPKLLFCPGPTKISMKDNGLDVLVCKLAMDSLEEHPMAVPLETQWWLNTKEALARSGLPTPKCEIIELEGCNDILPSDCCSACQRTRDADNYIPPECTGPRDKWLTSQIERITATIEQHPLPFGLKNQQSFGGAGVFLVHTSVDRAKVLKEFRDKEIFRKLFSRVSPSNRHLRPGNVVLSDLIADPISDTGLTMFVTDTGEYIFMGASEQVIENASRWVGNTINYRDQDRLKQKFATVMQEIATFLCKEGYFGPVGADVLETRAGNEALVNGNSAKNHEPPTEQATAFQVVDLNVRTSGSMALPLLRNHFLTDRDLAFAGSFCVTAPAGTTREGFIHQWQDEFAAGQMVLLSWYEDRNGSGSYVDGIVGAKNEEDLKDMLGRMKEGTERVRF